MYSLLFIVSSVTVVASLFCMNSERGSVVVCEFSCSKTGQFISQSENGTDTFLYVYKTVQLLLWFFIVVAGRISNSRFPIAIQREMKKSDVHLDQYWYPVIARKTFVIFKLKRLLFLCGFFLDLFFLIIKELFHRFSSSDQ